MIEEAKDRKTLAQLEETYEYQILTGKQKLFCATFCEGGRATGIYDPIAAVETAYGCKKQESARTMSYAMLQNPRIIAVLNLHFGRQPIDEFLVDINRAIRNRRLTYPMLQALRLKCEVLGIGHKLPKDNYAVPPDVREASRVARKIKKNQERAEKPPKPEVKSQYDDF